ncbi:MAG: ATP-binding protein [Chitinispirillaceae bacterium]|jgi:two-component system phosphate regulon sensor histidine kinase PhoR
MIGKKLTWQLLSGYIGIMIAALLVASWYTSSLYKKHFIKQTIATEKDNAYLIGTMVLPFCVDSNTARADSACKKIARDIGMRITIILPDGRVIGDSERNPDSMENHRYRPEVMDALRGTTGIADRTSATLRARMLYVATPVMKDGAIIAIVRTAVMLSSITAALDVYYSKIAVVAVLGALVAVLLGLFFARKIILPIQEIEAGAERFAQGELGAKLAVPRIDELSHLAVALNKMATQLDERIKTITAQRNELGAILASMSEGVIAVDADEHLLSVNASAALLFGIDRGNSIGRLLSEVIRNSAVQGFVKKVLASTQPVESDVTLPPMIGAQNGNRDRFLQMHGTILRDGNNATIGALLVASDVTRLRQLETVRKEFVANVSHELRTPLTTIKGFVETLEGGALENREDATRFLSIISEQVNRLNELLEDLLSLAVIEREEEARELVFSRHSILDTAQAAVKNYERAASLKNIALHVSGDAGCSAKINQPLLEQAIGNLIDNAIKYSESQRAVSIEVSCVEHEIVIAVKDKGIGIAPEHLNRLFERFYRVDKARSRKMGGTGLGLAIVKHIASTHGGRVTVESEPGKGSIFSIIIPAIENR